MVVKKKAARKQAASPRRPKYPKGYERYFASVQDAVDGVQAASNPIPILPILKLLAPLVARIAAKYAIRYAIKRYVPKKYLGKWTYYAAKTEPQMMEEVAATMSRLLQRYLR